MTAVQGPVGASVSCQACSAVSEPTPRAAAASTDQPVGAAVAAVLPDAHTTVPVPESETVSGVQVGMVCIGIAITLPALYTGGAIAAGLGLGPGLLAVLLAAALLSVMSVPSALMGVRTRLTSYMIIEHVFGWLGAKIVNEVPV